MFPRGTSWVIGILTFLPLAAGTDPDRDFSGVWLLDEQQSDIRALVAAPGAVLNVSQQDLTIRSTETQKDGKPTALWLYRTDDGESKYQFGDARLSSRTKWEGAALITNTIVTGSQNYAVMDRWRLSRDHNVLTIRRQIQRGGAETEAVLIYRNQRPIEVAAAKTITGAEQPPTEIVVPAGTKVPLALINSLSTKHSSEGDRVYLETVFPITVAGRIVIPRGSYVTGTVTEAKRPGRVKGKGELFLRFDSLTLPNGLTREFRSRLGGSDADAGEFDREEGKIRGEGNKGSDARTVAKTTGAGAAVGGIAGSAAGHAGMGVGIGAAAGAAAGLASVLLSRGPDLILPKGTSFQMVLDRDLRFKPGELGR
jgi:type IV secretion system protein VirB10